ncbi:MAG: tail fiber domain-containing protein [Lewinellaceae bacterium]|nr:tail fiber domain-containing protein [Lewinellaceae bacterium]
MRIDTDGNVGIGATTPANKLSVSGSADFTGNVGIGIASPATRLHVEGAASGSTSTDFVATIKNTDTDATNTTRYNGLKIQAGKVNSNGANSRFIAFYRPDGAEIGTVRQDGASTINFSTSSDVRLKQHIVPTAYSLADLLKIEVQDYEFRTEPGRKQTGFIAQDLYKVYPAAVSKGGEDVVTDPWMVDYGKLTPLLVKSVQDQQATIDAQQKRIAELEAQVARIDQLESLFLQMQQKLNNEKSEAAIK